MNRVILIGNLTKDVDLMQTTNGTQVARFTLAVKRNFGDESDFINIVAWRNQAESCHKYLKKGSKCAVVGSLQIRNYDAQDGTKRYVTEIIAEQVEFLSTKKEEPKEKAEELEEIDDMGDLPF